MKIAIISLGCPKNQVDADVFCHDRGYRKYFDGMPI